MDKDIRIVEIPTCKAIYSGLLDTEEKFEKFYKWVHSHEQDIFPRDFMRFNEKTGFNEWFYLSNVESDTYESVLFKGGTFIVATCIASSEDDGEDFENTFDYLISYASNSDMFELYHNDYVSYGLYPMFHMISSENLIEHGICQQDVYVPVRLKNNE